MTILSTKVPNTTFLCDNQRTGRLLCSRGGAEPTLLWKFRLPSYPSKGPESMSVFDANGNIYFGAHDGCFYSLDHEGRLRWMFKTGDKIYSSPTLLDDGTLLFASGTGHLFAFDTSGNMKWVYDLGRYFKQIESRMRRKIEMFQTRIKSYDHDRGKPWWVKCWSSPCVSDDGVVYITGYGLGLHALSVESGEVLWTYDLGSPRYHLSGVALNEAGEIFVSSQRRVLHCLRSDGSLKWKLKTDYDYDNWGNPSIDTQHGTVYFPLSYRERQGVLHAVDYDGRIKWISSVEDGIRGSVAISHTDDVVYCGLGGTLYFADRKDGAIRHRVQFDKVARALWTTPSIDSQGNVLLTTKEGGHEGSLVCLDANAKILWRESVGKALSVPVLDAQGRVYIGSWDGDFRCYQT